MIINTQKTQKRISLYAIIFIVSSLLCSTGLCGCQSGHENARWHIQSLDELSSAINITIDYQIDINEMNTKDGIISVKAASVLALERWATIFVSEMSLYPSELFKLCGLQHVIIGKDLKCDGKNYFAFFARKTKAIYLNIDTCYNELIQCRQYIMKYII